MLTFQVLEAESNQRIDKYIRKVCPDISLALVYKLFRKKDIKVNGKAVKESYLVAPGDNIVVYVKLDSKTSFSNNEPLQLTRTFKVIYEDDKVLIVTKPIGLLVQEDESEKVNTLVNQVLSYLYEKKEYDPTRFAFTPAPAHRLDRNTSGIVIFGKTVESLQVLNYCFKHRVGIRKFYQALVIGDISRPGSINLPLSKDEESREVSIDKDQGMNALTEFSPLHRYGYYTLLEVEIKTGRTHQIRVHLNAIGHPLVGDRKYGDYEVNRLFQKQYQWKYQFLHAYKIRFEGIHGILSYLEGREYIAPLSKESDKILRELQENIM